MEKYKFTGKTNKYFGRTLHQIVAVVAFGSVDVGEIGGWIESEKNLSHYGDAWVSGDARVYGDAKVYGNARVYGDARVCGNAQVYGDARVSGDAKVCGNAQVYGDAWVYGDAKVYGNARVYGEAWVCGNAQVYGDAWVSPVFIGGLKYSVTIIDTHIQIGCEYHSAMEWEAFDDRAILGMDGKGALKFWREHKAHIIGIARVMRPAAFLEESK